MAVSREDLSKLRQKFASDFNLLQNKFDDMMKVTRIINESNKALKLRVAYLEEKLRSTDESRLEDDDKTKIDDEIAKLKEEKAENVKEINDIEKRLINLEEDHKMLTNTVSVNKGAIQNCQQDLEYISEKIHKNLLQKHLK